MESDQDWGIPAPEECPMEFQSTDSFPYGRGLGEANTHYSGHLTRSAQTADSWRWRPHDTHVLGWEYCKQSAYHKTLRWPSGSYSFDTKPPPPPAIRSCTTPWSVRTTRFVPETLATGPVHGGCFLAEYLPCLQERQKWLTSRENLKVGDLVLLLNENFPRLHWPLGLITNTYPSPDGIVRSVQVKTQSGIYDRPITKLCLLEGSDQPDTCG